MTDMPSDSLCKPCTIRSLSSCQRQYAQQVEEPQCALGNCLLPQSEQQCKTMILSTSFTIPICTIHRLAYAWTIICTVDQPYLSEAKKKLYLHLIACCCVTPTCGSNYCQIHFIWPHAFVFTSDTDILIARLLSRSDALAYRIRQPMS